VTIPVLSLLSLVLDAVTAAERGGVVGSDSLSSNEPTASVTFDVIAEVAVEMFDTIVFNVLLLLLVLTIAVLSANRRSNEAISGSINAVVTVSSMSGRRRY